MIDMGLERKKERTKNVQKRFEYIISAKKELIMFYKLCLIGYLNRLIYLLHVHFSCGISMDLPGTRS